MKVCIISGTLPGLRCGVGDYTSRLCSELKRHNIVLDIVTSQNPEVKGIGGVTVRGVMKGWGVSRLGLLLKSVGDAKPDLVHIQYPTQAYKNKAMINLFPAVFKAASRKIPLVVTIHDVKTAHILNKLRLIDFLFCAERVILTTNEEKEYLTGLFPFLRAKFTAIPIGSNITPCEALRKEVSSIRPLLGVEKGEMLISHFGYMLRKKNLEVLFHSLRRLIDEGLGVKLIMISAFYPEKDAYHARLKKTVERLGLSRFVIWTGYCAPDKVSGYLFSSDICAQIYEDGVSFRRGSFIAALSHGLPIISTRVGALPDGLKEGDNLLAVRPGDAEALARAIKRLIESPDLRRRLGENISLLSGRFSWRKIADEQFALYQETVKLKR